MAMSEFEKKLIAELKGIKDELRKLNKGTYQLASPMLSEVDGVDISMGAMINNSLRGKGETSGFR